MKRTTGALLFAAFFLTNQSSAQTTFRADLDGSQVVLPTASATVGSAVMMLNETGAGSTLDYELHLDGLDLDGQQTPDNDLDDVKAVHIHVGAKGVNGGHVLNIFGNPSQDDAQLVSDPASATLSGTWDDSDARINPMLPLMGSTFALSDALLDLSLGNLYVQVHTTEFPNGEIRGQIVPVPEPSGKPLAVFAILVLARYGQLLQKKTGHTQHSS